MGKMWKWLCLALRLPNDYKESTVDLHVTASLFVGAFICLAARTVQYYLMHTPASGFISDIPVMQELSILFGMTHWSWEIVYYNLPVVVVVSTAFFLIFVGSAFIFPEMSFIRRVKKYSCFFRAWLAGGLLTFGLVGLAAAIMVLFAPAIRDKIRGHRAVCCTT